MIILCFSMFAAVALPVWVLCSLAGDWAEYTERERMLICWSLGLIVFVWLVCSR